MSTPTTTVVCHTRAPLLLEPVDRQIQTLQACESEGTIDELLLRSWPKEIALTDESPYQEALESFERFERWADARSVSVRPPFRKRTTTNQVTGETKELLVTPLLCLECYADDELIGVFPHTDETTDETYTTDEVIATLRTGELPTPLGEDGAPEPQSDARTETAGGRDCPDCGASLVDGQGLFACPDCRWVGTVTGTGQFLSRSVDSTTDTTAKSVVENR